MDKALGAAPVMQKQLQRHQELAMAPATQNARGTRAVKALHLPHKSSCGGTKYSTGKRLCKPKCLRPTGDRARSSSRHLPPATQKLCGPAVCQSKPCTCHAKADAGARAV